MSEQPNHDVVVAYQDHLRDAASAIEQWAQTLRLAADMIDSMEEPELDIALPPASRALGSISKTYEAILDHTLLAAEYVHISQRALARNLGMSQPTMVRRTKKAIAKYAEEG